MLPEIEDLKQLRSWPQVCARFGELIGLDGPAPPAVVRRALSDQRYAFYLLLTRDAPRLRLRLLEDPRNREYETAGKSTPELVGRAAKALARWTVAGLQTVDDETFQRRWASCQACPLLVEAPDRIVYKGLAILAKNRWVCSVCGCVAVTKARISTEQCPVTDPADSSRTRWGEPTVPADT
jgi:hypothetical protein